MSEELPELLREQKVSVRELARRVDRDPALISRIATGKTRPAADVAFLIAGALGLPEDHFWECRAARVSEAAGSDIGYCDRAFRLLKRSMSGRH